MQEQTPEETQTQPTLSSEVQGSEVQDAPKGTIQGWDFRSLFWVSMLLLFLFIFIAINTQSPMKSKQGLQPKTTVETPQTNEKPVIKEVMNNENTLIELSTKPITRESTRDNVYKMNIRTTEAIDMGFLENLMLTDYTELLVKGVLSGDTAILYDYKIYEENYARDIGQENHHVKNKFNNTYYIVIKKLEILPEFLEFSDQGLEISFLKESPNLLPYLESEKYCEVKEDCIIRSNFCAYGGYNKYHFFQDIWGCPGFIDEEGIEYFAGGEPGECGRIEYKDVDCFENSCKALDKACVEYY